MFFIYHCSLFSAAFPHSSSYRADITTLSIDSGDIDTVARYAKTGLITDATTNPLFVSQAGANGDARYEVRRFIYCCIFVHIMCSYLFLFSTGNGG